MSKEGRGIPGGASGPVAVDVVGGKDHQYVKVAFGGEGTVTEVEASAPFPTTDATLVALSKAEDAAHSSGHTGIPALAVRRDTASSLAGSDNDYLPLTTDSAGRAWVNVGASTIIGAVNETAPGTDTASSGLNGRLQRIAQRLTSLIALLPSSLGQKAKANSLPVTLASDEDLVSRLPGSLGQKAMADSLAVAIANNQSPIPVITAENSVVVAVPGATVAATGTTGYVAGNGVGTKLTLNNVATNKAAKLINVTVRLHSLESASGAVALDVVFFSENPTTTTFSDKAFFQVHASDAEKVSGVVKFAGTDFVNFNNGAGVDQWFGTIAKEILLNQSDGVLYAFIIARSGFTLSGDDLLSITFGFTGDV